ncbi:MAG TPA: ABC transporter permease, partial [Anaerolineae bacterium]|nr:ABC transporter permease [Anaerolineae bacterium]
MERLRELVRYRELVRNLVARDLKARYKSSVLGFLWCLVNPLLMMGVFTVVFTVLMPKDIPKYPVFILCALLPWNFFSSAVINSIGSITDNAHLIKKVYFPREVLPLSTVLSNLVNFLLALIVLFAVLFAFRVRLTIWALLLPAIILIQVVFTLGLSLILSALNVFYRDTGIIMETVMLAWFFLTPIFYRMEDLVPRYARLMYWINPMASIISSYRVILYHGAPPAFDFLVRTFVTALAFLVGGYLFFSRYSRVFGE